MACERKRKNITRRTWEHLKFARYNYIYKNTIERAWKYHLSLGLNVEDIVFRKIVYDAVYDALENKYGKIHWKEFLREYVNFINEYGDLLAEHRDKLQDWENYRQSEQYRNFIEHLKDIKRTDWRLKASIDNALAYMHLKWGGDKNWGESIQVLERKLKLDNIEKIWSKKAVWFLVDTLVFDANRLYAETEGRNEITVKQYDDEEQAIKIYVKRWYERVDYVDEDFKLMAKIYEKIITVGIGEIGSVILAEQLRKGTVIGLLHLAKSASRHVKTAKTLLGLASFLNGSVIAWLGWQILVEWTFDEEIQKALQYLFKYGFYVITGDNTIWEKNRLTRDELLEAINIYFKLITTGKITDIEKTKLEIFWELATTKQKEILWRILVKVQNARRLYNLKKSLYAEKLSEIKRINWAIEREKKDTIENLLNGELEEAQGVIAKNWNWLKSAIENIHRIHLENFKERLAGGERKEINGWVCYEKHEGEKLCLGRIDREHHKGTVLRDYQYSDLNLLMEKWAFVWKGRIESNLEGNLAKELIDVIKRYRALNERDFVRVLKENRLEKLTLKIQKNCVSVISKRDYRKSRIFYINAERLKGFYGLLSVLYYTSASDVGEWSFLIREGIEGGYRIEKTQEIYKVGIEMFRSGNLLLLKKSLYRLNGDWVKLREATYETILSNKTIRRKRKRSKIICL